MQVHRLEPDRQEMEWLLSGYWEFAKPRDVLAGITAQDACSRMAALPYSIAQIVAHMHWWQQRRLAIAEGKEPEDFELQVDDWPEVAPDAWDSLVESFLATFDEMLDLVDDAKAMGRVVFGDRNVGSMLVSHTTHNAYHLGQVILLRRLQGTWRDDHRS